MTDVSHLPADSDLRKWWLGRLAFYFALISLFAIIAFYGGPNEINFGSPFGLRAASFDLFVARRCVPVVRAMKEFQRDHGNLPSDVGDLVPLYLTPAERDGFQGNVWKGQFYAFAGWNHVIEYNFGPGREEWRIRGPVINGVLPIPPVNISPATVPSTQPQP
jgi:hypothetical protein